MKLVRWSFHNLHIPLMEADDGTLYCTNQVLTAALGISKTTILKMYSNHKNEFSGLCMTDAHTKEFFRTHKAEFGISYLRDDMHLWSEDDMILIAVLSRSAAGAEFRRGIVQLIKSNARRETVSREQYEADIADLRGQLQELKDLFENAVSAAGATLQAKKKVKHLRLVGPSGEQ